MFISRLNDLDEENNAIQEGFHPILSKQMDEVEEKHRALTLRAEKRRDYHKNAIEAVFAAQEKQIRDEFLVSFQDLAKLLCAIVYSYIYII